MSAMKSRTAVFYFSEWESVISRVNFFSRTLPCWPNQSKGRSQANSIKIETGLRNAFITTCASGPNPVLFFAEGEQCECFYE